MLKLDNLDDAEKFQKHFVTPLVEAVRAEVKPLVEAQAKTEERLNKLEANQKKALIGYGGVIAVVTLAFNVIKAKFLSKFFGA